jgi:hypothetical protein
MAEQPARPEIACLSRIPLGASVVFMAALLSEMVLAVFIGLPLRAGMAFVTALTLATAAVGLMSLGKCVLHPTLSAPLGVLVLGMHVWLTGGLTGLIGGALACVLMVLAVSLLGSALRHGLELVRRPWLLAVAACGLQILLYLIPSFRASLRAGSLAGFVFSVPLPAEGPLSGWTAAAETRACGLDLLEATMLAALMWRGSDGRSGSRRTIVVAGACALAAGVFSMGLAVRIPMLPFLVAGFYAMEPPPATSEDGADLERSEPRTRPDRDATPLD